MALTKGFSLIETLVAVAIASIAMMALMQVVSQASNTSANALRRFDSSNMTGVIATDVNDTVQGRKMSADEILCSRYKIDHPAIREFLKTTSYEIRLLPKELLNPLMRTTVNIMGSSPSLSTIAIQKVIIQSPKEKKSFFRLGTP